VNALADPNEELADAFFDALERGSIADVTACFAPDATIWHNFDRITLTPQQNVAGLETLFTGFIHREYRDIRRQPTPGGLVQQHVLRLTRSDGGVIDWPGCIVFDIAGGRITRLDEYVDIAQLAGA
jgi:ketosteroid isomerase-like protein